MLRYWGDMRGTEDADLSLFNIDTMFGERKEKYLYLQGVLDKYPELFRQD